MKVIGWSVSAAALLLFPVLGVAKDNKSYKHASEYQVAILDEHTQVDNGSDVTLGKAGGSGQGVHLLHTDAGNYRVEAPINKGMTMLSAMGSTAANPAVTYHNKWFLDDVQPGTKVLFASSCGKPKKKHPNDSVRCTFHFPDPDSTDHEFQTYGDFTPVSDGDGSNTQTTANALCGTGKLKPEVEAEVCPTAAAAATAEVPAAEPVAPPTPTFAPIPAPPPPSDLVKPSVPKER